MCVGPYIGTSTPTPKPAAQQVAETNTDVWRMLADKGGTMGAVAKAKLQEIEQAPTSPFPTITKK